MARVLIFGVGLLILWAVISLVLWLRQRNVAARPGTATPVRIGDIVECRQCGHALRRSLLGKYVHVGSELNECPVRLRAEPVKPREGGGMRDLP